MEEEEEAAAVAAEAVVAAVVAVAAAAEAAEEAAAEEAAVAGEVGLLVVGAYLRPSESCRPRSRRARNSSPGASRGARAGMRTGCWGKDRRLLGSGLAEASLDE